MNIRKLIHKLTAGLLFFLSIVPFQSLAEEPEEVIPIDITINMDWNDRTGNIRNIGTFMIKVTGKARLTKKKGERLRYKPIGMTATGKFKEKMIMESEGSDCNGQVTTRIEGSETVPVTDQFLIDINLGNLGRVAAMQYKGNMNIGDILNEEKHPQSDNYSSGLVTSFKVTYKGECGNEGYIKEFAVPIYLTIFKELTPMGMHGSYTWQSTDGLPTYTIHIGDFQGDKRLDPTKGQGAGYQVTWKFGKVTPIVQIWHEEKNITDRKNEVLVGEKVKLEAVVKPHWMSDKKGKWKIDKESILEDWKASATMSEKIEAKLDKKEIEFFWWKQNEAAKLLYILNEKSIKAQTEFKVIEPTVEIKSTAASDFHYIDEDCEIVPGPPSMRIKSVVKLKEDKPFCLQYVQLLESNAWSLKSTGKNFHWYNSVHEKKLDGRYPYGYIEGSRGEAKVYEGEKCGSGTVTIVMRDTPGGPVEEYAASLYMDSFFETYLMFRPGSKEDGNGWVPLKKVDWRWKVKLVSKINPYDYYRTEKTPVPVPPCTDRFDHYCMKPPALFKHTPMQAKDYPKWSDFVTSNYMQATGEKVIDSGDNYKQQPAQWYCSD